MLRKLLELGRYLLVIPVIGSLLLTTGVVVMAAGLIVDRAWHLLENGEFSPKSAKLMSVTVIETIDFFLVGALGYITAIGIYNLFITSEEEQLLKRIKIEKLKDSGRQDHRRGCCGAGCGISRLCFGRFTGAGHSLLWSRRRVGDLLAVSFHLLLR